MNKLFKFVIAAACMLITLMMLAACGGEGGGGTVIDKIIPKVTVKYNLDGGVVADDFEESYKINKGSEFTLTDAVPTREGHTFLGWYNGNSPAESERFATEDITITAKWKVNNVTVKFLDHYGDFLGEQTIDWGTAASAPEIPDKIGDLLFQYWEPSIDCVKEDITAKAIYDYNRYTVTFVTNGGTAVDPQRVKYGECTESPDSYKAGYTLSGWFKDKALTEEYLFTEPLDADTTLYAYFVDDYTEIKTAEELKAITNPSETNTGKYVLVNDINLNNITWTPIENFSGILDGNGHQIKNFALNGSGNSMGFVNTNAGTIKNMVFNGVTVVYDHNCSGGQDGYSGTIAAVNNGVISGCVIRNASIQMKAYIVSVSATRYAYMGGLVGKNTGTITECQLYGDITFRTSAEEYKGYHDKWSTSRPDKCYDCTYMYATLNSYLGGIVGENNGDVNNTLVNGTIAVNVYVAKANNQDSYANNYSYLGGIAGRNNGAGSKVSECTAKLDMNADSGGTGSGKLSDIGLIVGINLGTGAVGNCLAEGTLNISNSGQTWSGSKGGAIGYNDNNCTVINMFVDVDVSAGDGAGENVGGIIGGQATGGRLDKSVYTGKVSAPASAATAIIIGNSGGVNLASYYDTTSSLVKGGEDVTPEPNDNVKELSELWSREFLFDTLAWDIDRWYINEDANPTLK